MLLRRVEEGREEWEAAGESQGVQQRCGAGGEEREGEEEEFARVQEVEGGRGRGLACVAFPFLFFLLV